MMPKVDANPQLLRAIEEIVAQAGGNESQAARLLGTTRLRVNRIRKAGGGATPAVRNDLWKMIELLSHGKDGSITNDTFDTQTMQSDRDVPSIALQVLRYMTSVLEREISTEGRSNAR